MTDQRPRIETQLRSFFGFKSVPFARDLAPDQVFCTEAFDQALDRLRYLIDRRGVGALFGAPGLGKSTLLRTWMGELGRATHALCYVGDTACSAVDLYRQIARGFQLEPPYRKADVRREIKQRILKLGRVQKLSAVLVIDDAHLLPAASLDELRLLTSFDADGCDELTLVLAGHPQLESNLRLAVHEALAQRIVQRLRLRGWDAEEVERYLGFRLELAGCTARLFLPDAVEAIARAARGLPRMIDRIAEHSLLIALAGRKREIDADIVGRAVEEVQP
ncbi:MAG: ExeA family protein [Phycisphaerae bacterium]